MKKLTFLLLLFPLLFGACNAEKLLIDGNYDQALTSALKKYEKKPNDHHSLDLAIKAFNKLNSKNLEAINALEMEGKESNIDKIYSNYFQLYKRSFVIKPFVNDLKQFELVDYKNQLDMTAKKAGEYHYNKGLELLNDKSKKSAQIAYAEFYEAKKYNVDKEDLYELISQARDLGTVYVIISSETNSKNPIPASVESELLNLNLEKFNSKWVRYSKTYVPGKLYDYSIKISVDEYKISGDARQKKVYTEKNEIIEKYVLKKDSKGNVIKDDFGKPIKVPVKKEVKATITEIKKTKSSSVFGQVKFIDNSNMNTFKTLDINAEYLFENISGSYKGSKDALTSNSTRLVKVKEMDFPSQEQMLIKSAQSLRLKAQRAIHSQLNSIK